MSTDEELIKEIQNGNEYAMEILMKRHYKLIFSFIYRNVGDYHATYDIDYYGVDRKPIDDPKKQTSYKPYNWKDWLSFVTHISGFGRYYEKKFDSVSPKEFLLVPMSSKTLAGYEGTNDYAFNIIGGWSSVEPYLAGLYAMCCQVKPDITPDIFWSTALKTGDTMEIKNEGKETKTGKLINPVKLIDSLK